MIVIVANRWDERSRALAWRWADCDARILTPRDLSRAGWRQRLGQPARRMAVIDGVLVPQETIAAVLMRLPCVFEEELTHILPADRHYVAAEMTAFLTFWLAGLACPVINRPTPAYLAGPGWRPEQWAQLAAKAGFAVEPLRLPTIPAEEPAHTSMIVAGERCFGEDDPEAQARAQCLARLAGVELLTVKSCGPRFLGVDLLPDLSADGVADAVLDALQGGPRAAR